MVVPEKQGLKQSSLSGNKDFTEYKWWFQKNKDWNFANSKASRNCFSVYKWWFQKNKDWNSIKKEPEKIRLLSISGGSRKTRIETIKPEMRKELNSLV